MLRRCFIRHLASIASSRQHPIIRSVVSLGRAKADLKSLPSAAIDDLDHALFQVQCGLDPLDWTPIPSVGAGVGDIRVMDASGAFRRIYLATRPAAVYVLHCFASRVRRRRGAISDSQDND
jgi:phage-related protein